MENEYLRIYLERISDHQVSLQNMMESKLDHITSRLEAVEAKMSAQSVTDENQRLRIITLEKQVEKRSAWTNGILSVAISAFLTALFSATVTLKNAPSNGRSVLNFLVSNRYDTLSELQRHN